MKDWKTWRGSFHDAIQEGRKYAMSDEEMKTWAVEAGNYLAKNVCAGTAEEALIQSFQELLDPRFRGGDTFS